MSRTETSTSPFSVSARILSIQLGGALVIVLIWEVLVRTKVLNSFYYGQPSQVLRYFVEKVQDGTLLSATWITLSETLAGLVLGMTVGTALGLALWWSRIATALVRPLLVALNAVPKLIFAPIFILLVGLGY